MPRNYTGAKSGDTYTIPELTDRRDIEVAFTGFADSLPRTQQAINVEVIFNNKAAQVNYLYIYEGATPISIQLPLAANSKVGDRVVAYQLGADSGSISMNVDKGVALANKSYTAVSAIFDGARWVGLPFSFSGTRPNPGDSTGGTIVDLNGFRYHIFDMPGDYTFTSSWLTNAPQQVEVLAVGAGQAGTDGAASVNGQAGVGGVAGKGGQIVHVNPTVSDWSFIAVKVGSGGASKGAPGEQTAVGSFATAAGGSSSTNAPETLTGDWLAAIQQASAKSRPSSPWTGPAIGGDGGMGPSDPSTYGVGGGAGYAAVPSVVQGMETYSYTTGGPYTYPCNYGASSRQVQTGTTEHRGDTRPAFCPDGWRVSLVDHSFVQCQNIADPSKVAMNGWMGGCPGGWYACGMNCCTQVPVYGTELYCPGGEPLSGSTCLKDCTGDNTQHHTGTRPKPCGGGTVAQNGWCVDARPLNGGRGGDGLVAIRYPHP